jgi:hypothetical protein
MTLRSDSKHVGSHAEGHLRRFLTARDRGDAAGMREAWGEIVVDFYDRMDGFVAAAHRGALDDQEHELAVELSLIRFTTRLVDSFTGISFGELVNATRTLTRGICIDVQRGSIRERELSGRSLDADDSSWEHDVSVRRYDHEQGTADARAFLAWALPQVSDDRRRVLELTLEGAELGEIMQELQITRDNAYQRRSRGLKDLAKLKECYDA